MTVSQQIAATPTDSDFAFYNYGGSDIGSNLLVQVDGTNVMPTAGDGPGVVLPTALATNPLGVGVTMETIKASGSAGKVRTAGQAWVTANGSIAVGAVCMISTATNKLGFAQTQTAGKPQCGIALTAASDGDAVLLQLQFANNA